MNEDLKSHLTTVIVVSLFGIATATFALLSVKGNAASMDVNAFSHAIIIIPCVVMVICSFIILVTAQKIGRHLFLAVSAICFVTGIISMVITSNWMADPQIAELLLANTPNATEIIPPIQNLIIVVRDVAAYIVCPTVGSILGAWLGSRFHSVTRA